MHGMSIYITHRKATSAWLAFPCYNFEEKAAAESSNNCVGAIVSALPLLRHLGPYQLPAERESREQVCFSHWAGPKLNTSHCCSQDSNTQGRQKST